MRLSAPHCTQQVRVALALSPYIFFPISLVALLWRYVTFLCVCAALTPVELSGASVATHACQAPTPRVQANADLRFRYTRNPPAQHVAARDTLDSVKGRELMFLKHVQQESMSKAEASRLRSLVLAMVGGVLWQG